jgi:hypothetical protein
MSRQILLQVVQRNRPRHEVNVQTAKLGKSTPITVLGTVMGVVRDGQWYAHDVHATGPDGTRISLQVMARRRQRGAVSVRWDPSGFAEPRYITKRPWGLYAIAAILVVGVALGAWFLLA